LADDPIRWVAERVQPKLGLAEAQLTTVA